VSLGGLEVASEIATQAAQDADRILSTFWSKDLPEAPLPVDPIRIAQSLGIRVYEDKLPDGVSAAIVNNPGSGATIVLSRDDATNRKRFSCAHEIGHFVRHTNELDPIGYSYVDFRNQEASTGDKEEEVYANTFAASLLMPAPLIQKLKSEGLKPAEMIAKFGVSSIALANRFNYLGLN